MSTTTQGKAHAPMKSTRQWWVLGGFALAVIVAAGVGVWGVQGVSGEYADLQQPDWAPPSWLFSPVWTVLYAMIALAGWLAWRHVGFAHRALWLYGAQLVLNALWTPLFFGAGRYGLAFLDIVVLWVLIAATMFSFWSISRPAAWLLAPYAAWVAFAAALNFAIWTMN